MVLVNSSNLFSLIVVVFYGLQASGGLEQNLRCIQSFMFISLSDAKSKVWPQGHLPTPELNGWDLSLKLLCGILYVKNVAKFYKIISPSKGF